MATVKGKDNKRYNLDWFSMGTQYIENGRYFVDANGREWDSRQVKVLHKGLDTIKQLYKGYVKPNVFEFIENSYKNGIMQIQLAGLTWSIGATYKSGYRYYVKNDDLGVVVLFCAFHTEPKYEGHHLKIELSPHFINSRTINNIQASIDEVASLFIHQWQYTGVAIHLCVDVQGWTPPNDLDHKLVTRANRVYKYSAESSLEFENHAIARVHGKGQTFTFGGAGSLQFTVYDKSALISKNQAVMDYWHNIYSCAVADYDTLEILQGESIFNKDLPVYRLESRFHHSVIDQFARGLGQDLRSFSAVSEHLTGLWRYTLKNFRLDDSPTYINCFWQFMRDDIVFNQDVNSLIYQRVYKTRDSDLIPSDRQIKIIVGMLVSAYKRLKYTVDHAYSCLSKSGVFHLLVDLYQRLNSWNVEYTDFDAIDDIKFWLEQKLAVSVSLPVCPCD